jgi:hypothetical protein
MGSSLQISRMALDCPRNVAPSTTDSRTVLASPGLARPASAPEGEMSRISSVMNGAWAARNRT